ncbi:Na+/H+ antiporter NhaC family protein [Brevibacillus agri]|uniref:Na+/H+ antiporter NhaC family protein n=1 Tax=Brevibacillus TaxID=55080 RepID=UPI000412DD31|nr:MULTISPECIES: Na+/H+ antiporter NhaC family protein [Brevibacillus]MCG5253430.1 sodium:proton antiporter [Brevibacillus agri]MDN4095059.1 Na+/H+ antiporter NhaC family protein [Brevibacillus agri]MED3499242.1 Na+/H+ antiporter NhaC family protein [Brevibacillus agri]QHZ54792.1 sodium:proton antiporter [Brevibacillus sp. NSP2.1]
MSMAQVMPILAMIAGIVLSLSLGFPIALGIVFAILVTLVSVSKLGYSLKQQFSFGWEGVKKTKPVLMILFLVGVLIPLLMMGGTIPAIIYYGLSIVNVDYLFVLSFLLTGAVSYLLGTSVGTLSTIGLSLMGIAHAAGISPAIVGGALISGAMVGERFSPISSSRLLVLSNVGMTEEQDRRTRRPAMLATGICAVLFLLMDLFRTQTGSGEMISLYQGLLSSHFSLNGLLMLPLIVLIGSFALRVKAVTALLYGIVVSAVMVGIHGQLDAKTFFSAMLYGYELHSGTPLDQLVHGGGMVAILNVLLLIVLAGFLNGILNQANILTPIVDKLMGNTKNPTVLVAKAAALSLLVVIISCNQTIPILVLGSTLLERFSQWTGGRELLGKTMLDSTVVMPVLIPWNGLSMVMALTLGVPTVQTLPFVFFSIVLPIVTILSTRGFSPEGGFIATKNKAS